ncbi:hypothetical protein IAD21_03034 [Abditibacteriota bacterium]|nr:hypothetical protein IAD21_03034 [Abditibacteriota bacterium]
MLTQRIVDNGRYIQRSFECDGAVSVRTLGAQPRWGAAPDAGYFICPVQTTSY